MKGGGSKPGTGGERLNPVGSPIQDGRFGGAAATFLLWWLCAVIAFGDENRTKPADELRIFHATTQCIGIEWDLDGDANHDARCAVRFREAGTDPNPEKAEWREAPALLRIDYEYGEELHRYGRRADEPRRFNMFAGSLLFLEPATRYEVELTASDPDGGDRRLVRTIATRLEPRLPDGGRIRRVENSGQLADAIGAAAPGERIVLAPGDYGMIRIDRGGEPGRPVALQGEPGARAAGLRLGAGHVWIEGLILRPVAGEKTRGGGLQPVAASLTGVTVIGNRFEGFNYSIRIGRGHHDWHIADNVIIGDRDPAVSHFGGEGIEIGQSSGHVIAHNSISRTADPISSPFRNCDIYGNDIFDTSDDGFEGDNGYANNRVWGNSIRTVNNNALSFQPQFCGPWYFIRNHVVIGKGSESTCKFNGQVDRNVFVHNTFVSLGRPVIGPRANPLLNARSRNNLFLARHPCVLRAHKFPAIQYSPSWEFYQAAWKADLDRDGFAWQRGGAGTAGAGRGAKQAPFQWLSRRYAGLAEWGAELGIESRGVELDWERDLVAPADEGGCYTLTPESRAIDAGVILPGWNDEFAGAGPDLGAIEFGTPAPKYGPRITVP